MSPALLLRILRLRRQLRARERWSRRDLETYQAARLRDLRDHAYARSAFYRRLHRGLATRPLHELPIVTKPMLMEHFDELVTDPAVKRRDVQAHLAGLQGNELFRDRYWVSSTSGTTGLRGIFLADFDEWATTIASYARAYEWAGIQAGLTRRVKTAVVSSLVPWHGSARVGATVHSRFVPTVRLDATAPLGEIVLRLNAFEPEALVAYASMAGLLAEERLAGRLRVAPRAVLTASEVLTAEARARVEQAFGVRPFDVYAATEPAGVASDCPEHRMHLYEDLVITEVVDEQNQPVPIGQFGAKVLVTVLFSRTQPLIRYEMSDCVRLSTETCPCGRVFALLAGIQGRREDVLTMRGVDGATVAVHPNVFHRALEPAPVTAWQVVQEPEGVRVLVVAPKPGFDAAALAADVRSALTGAGVASPGISVQRVESIPRTAIGKAPLVKRLLSG